MLHRQLSTLVSAPLMLPLSKLENERARSVDSSYPIRNRTRGYKAHTIQMALSRICHVDSTPFVPGVWRKRADHPTWQPRVLVVTEPLSRRRSRNGVLRHHWPLSSRSHVGSTSSFKVGCGARRPPSLCLSGTETNMCRLAYARDTHAPP